MESTQELIIHLYLQAIRRFISAPIFYWEGVKGAGVVAELLIYPSAMRQCESSLHFCRVGIGKAQQKAQQIAHQPLGG